MAPSSLLCLQGGGIYGAVFGFFWIVFGGLTLLWFIGRMLPIRFFFVSFLFLIWYPVGEIKSNFFVEKQEIELL